MPTLLGIPIPVRIPNPDPIDPNPTGQTNLTANQSRYQHQLQRQLNRLMNLRQAGSRNTYQRILIRRNMHSNSASLLPNGMMMATVSIVMLKAIDVKFATTFLKTYLQI